MKLTEKLAALHKLCAGCAGAVSTIGFIKLQCTFLIIGFVFPRYQAYMYLPAVMKKIHYFGRNVLLKACNGLVTGAEDESSGNTGSSE